MQSPIVPEAGALAPLTCVSQALLNTPAVSRTRQLQEHIAELATPSATIPHEQVLERLLEQVEPVDFRALAGLTDEKQPVRTAQYVVLAVEEILSLATRNRWGLCQRQGAVYCYNGSYWKVIEVERLKHFLKQAAERQGVPPMRARHYRFGEQLFSQFLDSSYLLRTEAKRREMVLVNLQNGTFEFGPGVPRLRPASAADFITHELPFVYDPHAVALRWQAFLDRVVPDKEVQQLLAEYLGYIFVPSGKLKLEKVLLVYGVGANGKSVLFEIISALLGPENVGHNSLAALTKEPAYARAQLGTKLVNYNSELGGKIEADTFKQLASGEPIEARLPYGQPFTMTHYGKLIFNTNELPLAAEHTPAFFRRFLIVPFSVTIPEQERDPTLASTIIAEELSGVFNWILAGLERLLAQGGFSECAAVQQQVEDYKLQSDSVRLFLQEVGYERDPQGASWLPTQDIFTQYRTFCLDYGLWPVGRGKFVARLHAASVEEKRRNTGKVLGLRRVVLE